MKQIKAPYVSDMDHGIALHTMQGNRASSHSEGDISCFFPNCGRNLGYILELQRGLPFKVRVCSVTSGLMSSYEGHFRSLLEAWQGNINASGVRMENQCPFLVATVILGFLAILNKSQASSYFEAFNSACPSR